MNKDSIVIVGVACHLPGAADVNAFWSKLHRASDEKRFCDIPTSRWSVDDFHDPEPGRPGKIYQRSGGFLTGIENFNWTMFDLSRDEALRMDPQQRVALELTWQALDMANIRQDCLRGSATGVYMGVSHTDQKRKLDDVLERIHAENGQNTYHCFVANRLSYFFDLQGPSISFDSACSSGLSALQAGCRSLADGEIDVALVGAVNLFLMPHEWISSSAAGTLSRTGLSRPFDDRADGYVRSEGAVMLVLMRAKDAMTQDKDILGVVKSVCLNHNGQSNGISAPNGKAVGNLLAKALAQGGIQPAQIDYYEAHATATLLGDAIEIRAVDAGLASPQREQRCVLGSVKGDIGHTEAASSLAGLLKVLLCLRHERLFSFTQGLIENRHFSGKLRALEFIHEARPWSDSGNVRYAVVAALGFGGSNGMAVIAGPEALQAHRARAAHETAEPPTHFVIALSAADVALLRSACEQFAQRLADATPREAAGICRAANWRANLHRWQLLACASTPAGLAARLHEYAADGDAPGVLQIDTTDVAADTDPRQCEDMASTWHDDAWSRRVASLVDGGGAWNPSYGTRPPALLTLPVPPLGGEPCWYGHWKVV